jgi:hypothetical protein
MALGQEDKGS